MICREVKTVPNAGGRLSVMSAKSNVMERKKANETMMRIFFRRFWDIMLLALLPFFGRTKAQLLQSNPFNGELIQVFSSDLFLCSD